MGSRVYAEVVVLGIGNGAYDLIRARRILRLRHDMHKLADGFSCADKFPDIAAPASCASSAELAISRGVTGIAGCLPTVSPAPVTAQEMMTFAFNIPPRAPRRFCATAAGRARLGAFDASCSIEVR